MRYSAAQTICIDSRAVFPRPPLNYNIEKIRFLREKSCDLGDPCHAAARYSTEEALDVFLDNSFGLSNGESSEEEAVEQFYAHTGDPVLREVM